MSLGIRSESVPVEAVTGSGSKAEDKASSAPATTPRSKLERRLSKAEHGYRLDLSTYKSPTGADFCLDSLPERIASLKGRRTTRLLLPSHTTEESRLIFPL